MEELDFMEPCCVCCVFYINPEESLLSLEDENASQNDLLLFIKRSLESWNIKMETEDDMKSQKICNECIGLFTSFYELYQKCTLSQMLLAELKTLRHRNQLLQIKTEPSINYESNECFNETESSNFNCNPSNDYIEISNNYIAPNTNLQIQSEEVGNPENSKIYQTYSYPHDQSLESIEILSNDAIKTNIIYLSDSDESQKSEKHQKKLYINSYRKLRVNDQNFHTKKTCHLCGKRFKYVSRNFFNRHIRYHKYRNILKCSRCWYTCRSYWGMVFHIQAVHYQTFLDIDDNVSSLQPQNYNCVFCKKEFFSSDKLQEHLRHEHNPSTVAQDNDKIKYKCSFCLQSFKLQFMLNRHLEKKHKH